MPTYKKKRRKTKRWPRAFCSHCGHSYIRATWKKHWYSGMDCGVRTCIGKLWVVPNEEIGWAINKLERDLRAKHAKLNLIVGVDDETQG